MQDTHFEGTEPPLLTEERWLLALCGVCALAFIALVAVVAIVL